MAKEVGSGRDAEERVKRLPIVRVPGAYSTITEAAKKLGDLFAGKNKLFNRGGCISLVTSGKVAEMDDNAFPSYAEQVARFANPKNISTAAAKAAEFGS